MQRINRKGKQQQTTRKRLQFFHKSYDMHLAIQPNHARSSGPTTHKCAAMALAQPCFTHVDLVVVGLVEEDKEGRGVGAVLHTQQA